MTPLAQAIANDACLPAGKRRFGNLAEEIGLFDGLHFFDCTAVVEAAEQMARKMVEHGHRSVERLAFLPAPRVWVESALPANERASRVAYILEQHDNEAVMRMVGWSKRESRPVLIPLAHQIPLIGHDDLGNGFHFQAHSELDYGSKPANLNTWMVYALLAMINTPRVINRRQHTPHRGLEKKLAAARGMVGKFPLRAWTELKLEVRPPRDASCDGATEAHFTGAKALHFCRCHLRIRLGHLEIVSAHWRGDPALGIKQTRYAVIPPKDGNWPKWAAQPGATP